MYELLPLDPQRHLTSKSKVALLESNPFSAPDSFVNRFDKLNRFESVVRGHGRGNTVEDRIDERSIFLNVAPLLFFLRHVPSVRLEVSIHATRIEQGFHLLRHDRAVMTKYLDPFERKMPARIR